MLIWTKTKFAHVRRHDRTFKKQSCVQCLHSDEQNHFELFFATNDLAAIIDDCLHFWPCPHLHGSDSLCKNQILRAKRRLQDGSRSLFEVLLLSFSRTLPVAPSVVKDALPLERQS